MKSLEKGIHEAMLFALEVKNFSTDPSLARYAEKVQEALEKACNTVFVLHELMKEKSLADRLSEHIERS